LIRNFYAAAEKYGKPRLLFSAHGLPEKIVQAGDPYQFQCEQTVTAIIKELDIAAIDYVLCYQSRVGPMKWLGPETSEEIKRAGKDKVPILLVPITFTCENSETLYETDILYKQEAVDAGVPHYGRVPTVSIEPEFIEGLANLTRAALKDHRRCISGHGSPICPPDFSGCFCRGRI
jgi:ferrochelatase